MARGWESKDVESQLELKQADRASEKIRLAADAELRDKDQKRSSIELQKQRVQNDLQAACNPRYRAQLEEALRFLDGQLAQIV
jgi:tRNA threonylcarbamoyladenosine modification (KEOPS) complex  Pcc1 subunit